MSDSMGLTLCTVSFGHALHLRLNHALCERLNPSWRGHIKWLIAENAPDGVDHRITEDDPFTMLPGSVNTGLGASYHHAEALNGLLRYVRTRFALVLDPDFYILHPNWLDEIPRHMEAQELAFFGAPWHPRYTENYRYFPAVHCMFIDTGRVPLDKVDFRPNLGDDQMQGAELSGREAQPLRACMLPWLKQRRRKPWDTGTRVFQRFASDPAVKVECLIPFYRLPEHWQGAGNPLACRSRLIECFLPDEYCYLPKKQTSYTSQGFREKGFITTETPLLWEEVFWKGLPFGLHMRRSYASNRRTADSEFSLLIEILGEIESHPCWTRPSGTA